MPSRSTNQYVIGTLQRLLTWEVCSSEPNYSINQSEIGILPWLSVWDACS